MESFCRAIETIFMGHTRIWWYAGALALIQILFGWQCIAHGSYFLGGMFCFFAGLNMEKFCILTGSSPMAKEAKP